MKDKSKHPVNIYGAIKAKKIILDSTALVSINKFQNSYNVTSKHWKPISKII